MENPPHSAGFFLLMNIATQQRLQEIYTQLYAEYGDLHWWPGETPFEVAVGAILTQNTAWSNVEKAITNLKNAQCLTVDALLTHPKEKIEALIRPSGFFTLKSERLLQLCLWWKTHVDDSGKTAVLRQNWESVEAIRTDLLRVKGVGPETADSILLYALQQPTFVIDSYTKRMLTRHFDPKISKDYETLRQLFMNHLPLDVALYNQFHALIVENAKQHCRKQDCNCVLKNR